ncbi:MAG: 5-dehydro-4-deoxy-D-glucuronate isomerase [Calditrichia bacterium]|nr:5-dehydro-4-deoxy-D-glucuronate isomerase [Calditrichia bacterium]
MTTTEQRESFLIDGLFKKDKIMLFYLDIDRVIIGSAVPIKKKLKLGVSKELASQYFTQRREIGVLNIGGNGSVSVDKTTYRLDHKDMLYIGRGSKDITFLSKNASKPAKFYLLSYPAHKEYPTKLSTKKEAEPVQLGSMEESNKRTIYKLIHPGAMDTCQVVMGFTELELGSVWNTMPPHTHERRMEVYMYFDMASDSRVFHLMGPADETRHLVVANGQAVVSPSWSLHSGVGTGAYTFCWGMGGENQAFDDMDHIAIGDLR